MKILELTITNFSNMENSVAAAEYIEDTVAFMDDEWKTAHAKCCAYLTEKKYIPYLGWNEEVYPKFKVESKYLK